MNEINRDNLERERIALLGNIHSAFAGVSREGGVSWSETYAIDDMDSDEVRLLQRQLDTESSWEELVDDPEWWMQDISHGGFSFLDAIGFRYYIPAAMTRVVKESDVVSNLATALQLYDSGDDKYVEWQRNMWSKLNAKQRNVIKRFLLYMSALASHEGCGDNCWWREAYESYWKDA